MAKQILTGLFMDPLNSFRCLVFAFWSCLSLVQGVAVIMEGSKKSKFTIHISLDGLECFGVDTPVSLVTTE